MSNDNPEVPSPNAIYCDPPKGLIGDPQPQVHQVIANVIRDMNAVSKSQTNAQQGWAFRGIEDITAALKEQLGKHGLVLIPKVRKVDYELLTVNGKPWREATVTMTWKAYGPAGDSLTIGPIIGKGRDNSDKDVSKAMSIAFKYALLQTFCIADPTSQDPDREKHETDSWQGRPKRTLKTEPKRPDLSARQAKAMAALGALPPSTVAVIKNKAREAGIGPVWAEEQCGQIEEWIEAELTAPFDAPEEVAAEGAGDE